MNKIYKILTIVMGALIALLITRMGISYWLTLLLIGFILTFLTNDKKVAILSGVLYATLGYMLSYPSGLFLVNYMPDIDIPITVNPTEVAINLLIGWIVPVIISIILSFIASIFGKYASKLWDHEKEKDEKKYYFDTENEIKEEYFEDNMHLKSNDNKKLIELSPIQKAKNKYKKRIR